MISRLYYASITFAFLSAGLIAGCEGAADAPGVPADPQLLHRTHQTSAVRIWASVPFTGQNRLGYLVGLSAGAKEVLDVINTRSQPVPGYGPIGLQVDHSQNLWVANLCNGANYHCSHGVVQEYNAGTFVAAYVGSCPVPSCSNYGDTVSSVAVNSSNVFVPGMFSWSVGSYSHLVAGYAYWPNGNPSASPTYVNIAPVGGSVGTGDLDSSGNLWLIVGAPSQGAGLGEVTNPTTNPSLTVVEPYGTYSGGGKYLYISKRGTVLNVEVAGTTNYGPTKIYQYALPLSPSGTPFHTLTVCTLNCHPGGFGFNQQSKQVVVGDGFADKGWLDMDRPPANHWKRVNDPQFDDPFSAAVYTPSDK